MTDACAALACDRDAADGLACREHGRRFRDHLGAREGLGEPGCESHGLPWMWSHLRGAYPSIAGWKTPGATGPADREAERLAAVVGLRADIRDWLGSVAADLAERLERAGPPRVRLTTDYRRRHVGRDVDVVRGSARWLLTHADALLTGQGLPEDVAAEMVGLLLGQADDLASRAHALAPWQPVPTAIDGVPCRCMARALHDHGDQVTCWSCGRSYTREEYTVLCKVLARRFADIGVSA